MSDSLKPHELYSPWNSPGQNTGVNSYSLLQAIFPTQGSNPGLPPCRQILYQLSHKESHKGSPRILEWVVYPLSRGSSWPRNQTRVSCSAGRFFTSWAIREALGIKDGSWVKNLPAMQEIWVWSLGWEDPLEGGMVTHPSILVWRFPWTEEPGGLQSMELQRVGHNWATKHSTQVFLMMGRFDRGIMHIYDAWLWGEEATGQWRIFYV